VRWSRLSHVHRLPSDGGLQAAADSTKQTSPRAVSSQHENIPFCILRVSFFFVSCLLLSGLVYEQLVERHARPAALIHLH
jgi:hypothetical protein